MNYEDLKSSGDWERITDHLETRFGKPLSQDFQDNLLDVERWSKERPKQVYRWLFNTGVIAGNIIEGKETDAHFPLFWIRLHDIINTLPDYFSRYVEWQDVIDKIKDKNLAKHFKLGFEMYNLINDFVALFNEDELLLIEHERHSQAHIFQDGYIIQAKVKADDQIKFTTRYKGIDRREHKERIQAILKQYSAEDDAIAREYVERIKDILAKIIYLCEDWVK